MTADCSLSWTSWTIKVYVSFKLFSFVPESKFSYLSHFPKKKKKKIYIYIERENDPWARVDMEFLFECLTR